MVAIAIPIPSTLSASFYICILILNDILLLTIIFVFDFDKPWLGRQNLFSSIRAYISFRVLTTSYRSLVTLLVDVHLPFAIKYR